MGIPYIYIHFSFTDLLGNLGAPPTWPSSGPGEVPSEACEGGDPVPRSKRKIGDFSLRNRARNWANMPFFNMF